jgi:hypothetical protein
MLLTNRTGLLAKKLSKKKHRRYRGRTSEQQDITRHAGNGRPVAVSGAGLQMNRGFNGHGEVDSQSLVGRKWTLFQR